MPINLILALRDAEERESSAEQKEVPAYALEAVEKTCTTSQHKPRL